MKLARRHCALPLAAALLAPCAAFGSIVAPPPPPPSQAPPAGPAARIDEVLVSVNLGRRCIPTRHGGHRMLLASRQRVLLVRSGSSWRVGAAARTMGYGGPEEPPASSTARRDARERALVDTARAHLSRFAPADLEAHLAPLATARVTPRTCHAAVTVTVRSGSTRRVLVRCREDDYGDPSHLPEASGAAGTFAAWLAPLVSQVTYLR